MSAFRLFVLSGVLLLLIRAFYRPAAINSPHLAPIPTTPSISPPVDAAVRRASYLRMRRFKASPPPPPKPQQNLSAPSLLFMMRTPDAAACAAMRGVHVGGQKCKRPCTAEPALPPAAPMSTTTRRNARLRWREPMANGGFAGNQTLAERASALKHCGVDTATSCGFLSPSSFDHAAKVSATAGGQCDVVVLTSIIGSLDNLRQPLHTPNGRMADCFFAFVDSVSSASLIRQQQGGGGGGGGGGGDGGGGGGGGAAAQDTSASSSAASSASAHQLPRVGVWRLIILDSSTLPFQNARRDSRVPKMLPHRLFPSASYCIWVDGKQPACRPESTPAMPLHSLSL